MSTETPSSIVDKLNSEIVPTEDFEYDEKDIYDLPYIAQEIEYVTCELCSNHILKIQHTGNWTTSIDTKIGPGLRCGHCGRLYCSYTHMKPKILVENSEKIEPITGLKSCIIYQICKAYLSALPLEGGGGEDPFSFKGESDGWNEPYCSPFEMDDVVKNIVGFSVVGIGNLLFYIEKSVTRQILGQSMSRNLKR